VQRGRARIAFCHEGRLDGTDFDIQKVGISTVRHDFPLCIFFGGNCYFSNPGADRDARPLA
jgi:hypothetical protein